MGYTRDAVKGVSWIGSLSFMTKALGFIEIIILARILLPVQFGAYAVALLVLGLLETLTQTGVNVVLLQEEKIEGYLNSAWIVSIVRGFAISLALIISAPFISIFFHSPGSENLLLLISAVPFLRGFINPAIVKFQKELQFNKNFLYQASIVIVDTLISITLTYQLKNPIGIVVGLISGVMLELILSFAVVKPRPSLNFNSGYASMIFNRGKWITGVSIFDYLFHNLDNAVVGRMLGASSLGVYQLAYSIAVMPLEEIGKVFVHVSVPILVRLRGDEKRLRSAFSKMVISTTLLAVPVAIFIFLFPGFFVTILGQKWQGIEPILPILALLGLIKAVSNASGSILLSNRKQKYSAIVMFVGIAALAVTIVPFVAKLGIYGASLSATISAGVAIPFIIFFVWKTLNEKV